MNGIAAMSLFGVKRASARAAAGPCTAISAAWSSLVRRTSAGNAASRSAKSIALREALTTRFEPAVRAGRPRDHQIVDDAAVGVEELRVALPSGSESRECRPGTDARARARSSHGRVRRAAPDPCARRRTARRWRASADAPPEFQTRIGSAFRSRRTAPYGRRTRHAARIGACAGSRIPTWPTGHKQKRDRPTVERFARSNFRRRPLCLVT